MAREWDGDHEPSLARVGAKIISLRRYRVRRTAMLSIQGASDDNDDPVAVLSTMAWFRHPAGGTVHVRRSATGALDEGNRVVPMSVSPPSSHRIDTDGGAASSGATEPVFAIKT